MKKWIREWIKIDVLLLGIFVLLTSWLYIIKGSWTGNSTTNSILKDYLPNIATELLGVWLSVRIIDKMIKNRYHYHDIRKDILNFFERLSYDFEDLEPFFDKWRIDLIFRNLRHRKEKFEYQLKHFEKDEIEIIRKLFSNSNNLAIEAKDYISNLVSINDFMSNAVPMIRKVEENRSNLLYAVERFERENPNYDLKTQPLPKEVEQYTNHLSKIEIDHLRNNAKNISSVLNLDIGFSSVPSYYRDDILHEFKNLYEQFSKSDYQDSLIKNRIETFTSNVMTIENLPNSILNPLKTQVENFNTCLIKRKELLNKVNKFWEELTELKANILDETEV